MRGRSPSPPAPGGALDARTPLVLGEPASLLPAAVTPRPCGSLSCAAGSTSALLGGLLLLLLLAGLGSRGAGLMRRRRASGLEELGGKPEKPASLLATRAPAAALPAEPPRRALPLPLPLRGRGGGGGSSGAAEMCGTEAVRRLLPAAAAAPGELALAPEGRRVRAAAGREPSRAPALLGVLLGTSGAGAKCGSRPLRENTSGGAADG